MKIKYIGYGCVPLLWLVQPWRNKLFDGEFRKEEIPNVKKLITAKTLEEAQQSNDYTSAMELKPNQQCRKQIDSSPKHKFMGYRDYQNNEAFDDFELILSSEERHDWVQDMY